MKRFVVYIGYAVIIAILYCLLLGFYFTWVAEHSANQDLFVKGALPNPSLDGDYKGSANFNTGPWRGKTFDQKTATGANLFRYTTRFPFKTYAGKGIRDKELDVLKLDYNLPQNPFWLRIVIDEIVQVAPEKYLGKAHILLIPEHPFTVTYFTLVKQE